LYNHIEEDQEDETFSCDALYRSLAILDAAEVVTFANEDPSE
jgi:hypothetical protein